MSIKLQCECGRWLKMPDESAGRRARCPACQTVFTVPEPVAVEPSVESAVGPAPEPEPLQVTQTPAESSDNGLYDFVDTPLSPPPPVKPLPSFLSVPNTTNIPAAKKKFEPARVEPVAGSTSRPYRYLILLLVLLPLAWSTFKPGPKVTNDDRFDQTLTAHPEYAESLKDLPEHPTVDDVLAALPTHRFEGALLPANTWMHWGFAVVSGAAFFGLVLLLFPPGHTKIWHLLIVCVFTGTIGIILLLAFQWIAFHFGFFVPRGIIGLLLDIVAFIGWSYRVALEANSGFLLSALGFTAGVGFCEEACKALPLIFVARTTGFLTWRSAMIWGLMSGVGFGVSEGITYSHDFYNGIYGMQMYLIRFVSCVGLHGIWAAATGINIFRRQDFFRGQLHPLEWIFQVLITVIVPMVLHGLYDTLLKQEYDWAALLVAFASFGWLAWQIELAKRKLDALPLGYAV